MSWKTALDVGTLGIAGAFMNNKPSAGPVSRTYKANVGSGGAVTSPGGKTYMTGSAPVAPGSPEKGLLAG